ncbi:MAG: transposase [Anaerolineae bacterium]
MVFRLYPSTRRLFQRVVSLRALGLLAAFSPLTMGLVALYVTGLILLDQRQNGTRMANWLPARAHDALHRLLRTMELSTRAIMRALIAWAKTLGKGYLILDDGVVSKPFSLKCPWVGWTYSTGEKRKVRGLHIVILLWCTGCWRIPVAFRLWRPKQQRGRERYRTKPELAWEMILEVYQEGLSVGYIVFDTFYTAGWLTKKIARLGWLWQGPLHPRTTVIYRHRCYNAASLAKRVKLKWRAHLELRACSVVAYLPKYGTLRLVVTRNRHGNEEVLATNDLGTDLTTIVRRKRTRWSAETLFRDAKQLSGLGACQCRVDQAMVRHMALVLLAFVVLQPLRLHPKETLGETKDRLQREVMAKGWTPPSPLRGPVAASRVLIGC